MCIIAQTVATKLRDELKESGWLDEEKGNSFSRCIDEFHDIGIGRFQIDGKKVVLMSKINNEHRRLLKLLGLDVKAFSSYENAQKAVD